MTVQCQGKKSDTTLQTSSTVSSCRCGFISLALKSLKYYFLKKKFRSWKQIEKLVKNNIPSAKAESRHAFYSI